MKYLCVLGLALVLFRSCERDTIKMVGFEIHGIDVSHHQQYIQWDSVAMDDISFVFVKATEGATHRDTLFPSNWGEITRVGIKKGAYHFFRPATSAEDQANNFIEYVSMDEGDLPPVLDVEVLDEVSKIDLISRMRTWLYMVELHYDIKPIIYTNVKFYNQHLAGHFDEYPYWIARYNDDEPVLKHNADWTFWQYGNRGKIAGVSGYVDYNVFYGDAQSLDDLCLQPKWVLSIR